MPDVSGELRHAGRAGRFRPGRGARGGPAIACSGPDDNSAVTASELTTGGPAPAATAAWIAVVEDSSAAGRHAFQAGRSCSARSASR